MQQRWLCSAAVLVLTVSGQALAQNSGNVGVSIQLMLAGVSELCACQADCLLCAVKRAKRSASQRSVQSGDGQCPRIQGCRLCLLNNW